MSAENGEEARVFPPTAIAHFPRTSHPSPTKSLRSSRLCGAIGSLALAAILATPVPVFAASAGKAITMPDFTKGDSIPAAAKHDWNLGATGARGWMFCDKLVTTDARQIAITKVETGSPADGILAVGDVLLGVGVKPLFADSIRVEGLQLLAKHRIAEGISACVKYTRDQNPWDSQERTPKLMKILLTYGTHAKSVIPELTRIADYFEKDEKDFPKIYLG